MSLKQIWSKPKWEHKDPAVRAAAVADSAEPELLEALRRIAIEDPEYTVRAAAIRRLSHLPTLLTASERAASDDEQRLIATRLHSLTTARGTSRPPLAQRMAVIEASSDRALLEAAALQAPESELRRAALEKVERQGVLGDAAIADPDPANRRMAADRITQQSTLQRVAEAVRKSDKALHQELQSRLHAQRLAAGDPAAVSQEALRICMALENFAAAPQRPAESQVGRLEESWSGIAGLVSPELRQRHDAVIRRLHESASKPETETRAQAVDPEPGPPDPPPETALQQAPEPGPEPARAQARDDSALLDQLDTKLALFHAQLEAGELHKALATRGELHAAGKRLGGNRRWQHIQRELLRVQGRLRELRDWLHWSNNKIRKRLIREMQALPGSGLHPDAVLHKLKELQSEWKELELSEQIPGEKHFSAPPWMWRKFNQAGRTAFELTKPFLDKRSEVQQSHLEEMRDLRAELDALSGMDEPDWLALRRVASRASRGLRALGAIPARARKKMSSDLRTSLEVAHARLAEHHADVEKTKRGLIRAAAQLEHAANRDEAIATAKSLQAEWKAAGSLRRALEQKLWKEFRRPIDPLFEQLESDREAEQAEQAQDLDAQKALVKDLHKILAHDDGDLAGLRGKVQGLDEAWQQVRRPSTRLRKEFQRLAAQFDTRIRDHERRQAESTRERWWLKADLLHTLEAASVGALPKKTASDAQKAWPAAAEANTELDAELDGRCVAALNAAGDAAPTGNPDTIEQGRLLCIRLEFLAGLPSPDAEQEMRMKYQVERLSASMAGDSERLPARREARLVELDWLELGYIPDPEHGAFRTRIRNALREIYKE